MNETLEKANDFEANISILVGVTFGLTFLIGLLGNCMVLGAVLLKKKKKSTTSILIVNLAFAELVFILLCVPATGSNYILKFWHFGDLGCRITQYVSYVSGYITIALLVFMSLDRYLAFSSIKMSLRRKLKITRVCIAILWFTVLVANLPQFYLHSQHEYSISNEHRAVCILDYGAIMIEAHSDDYKQKASLKLKIYYLVFFIFAYLLPIITLVIIYSLIIRKLIKINGQQVSKKKKKITFMVVLVVTSFVICWTPLHIMLFLQHVVETEFNQVHVSFLIVSNCVAYSNACINPSIFYDLNCSIGEF